MVIVEDSTVQRANLRRVLEADGAITVVAEAASADEAVAAVRAQRPDVVTMDLHIPGGGVAAIDEIMRRTPTPVLVLSVSVDGVSGRISRQALEAGAVDAVQKPSRWTAEVGVDLRRRVRAAAWPPPGGRAGRRPAANVPPAAPIRRVTGGLAPVLGLAASTGGPAALARTLVHLDALPAPVLVVQHLHDDFMAGFVEWMGRATSLPVRVAADGDVLEGGVVYLAPPGAHLALAPPVPRSPHRVLLQAAPATLHRPSADVLFASLAALGPAAVAALMTGMGDDGAAGLLAIRRVGGHTIAQDESSSAVFGMPRAAIALGAALEVLALDDLGPAARRAVLARVPS